MGKSLAPATVTIVAGVGGAVAGVALAEPCQMQSIWRPGAVTIAKLRP